MKPSKLIILCGVLFLFFLSLSTGLAQNAFITVWQTDNESIFPGPTNDQQILIPATGSFFYFWQEVDADGNLLENSGSGESTDQTILTFPHTGTYRLEMISSQENPFNQLSFFLDAGKIIDIQQWGDVEWSTFALAFSYTDQLDISATDIPNLSNVTLMTGAFMMSGIGEVPNINQWNVSQVVQMEDLFFMAENFNSPIGDWAMSQVVTTTGMFRNAYSFNQPIANWDVGNVTDMMAMFNNAISFNQPIGDWDVSNVTNMSYIFSNAQVFNQPIDNWDVGNVTSMFGAFSNASNFNQPLANWNVGSVKAMDAMFKNAVSFNQPIGEWDTSNVLDMGGMFFGAISFNQPIGDWDVSEVIRMNEMFLGTLSFEQDISDWNVSSVTGMANMFRDAIFNLPIAKWDVSNVTSMWGMFMNNPYFNQSLENWNVSNVANMREMFRNAQSFNQPLNNWNVDLYDAVGILHKAQAFDQPLTNWNLKHLIFTDEIRDEEGFYGDENSFSFAYSGMSCENYSLTLQAWANNPETSNQPLILLADTIKYSPDIEDARNALENDFNWTILGDALSNCSLATDSFSSSEIKLHPNPVKDILMIEGLSGNENLFLYDLNGKLIYQLTADGNSLQLLDMEALQKGIYFLSIQMKDGKQVNKKVVKKY